MKESIISHAEKKWGIRLKGNRMFGGKKYRLMGVGIRKRLGDFPRKKYHSFRTVTYFCKTCKKRTPIYATYLHGRE